MPRYLSTHLILPRLFYSPHSGAACLRAKTIRLQQVCGGGQLSQTTGDHASAARTIKTTRSPSGCCSPFTRGSFIFYFFFLNVNQLSKILRGLFVKAGAGGIGQCWQTDRVIALRPPAGEKCGLLWKHAEEEVWRLQNKSVSTNHRPRSDV